MDVHLHQRPVLSPAFPPARREGPDVLGGALDLVLEVVTSYVGWMLACGLHHEDLTEVDKDHHQHDGVW
jgi:hypothetical protein